VSNPPENEVPSIPKQALKFYLLICRNLFTEWRKFEDKSEEKMMDTVVRQVKYRIFETLFLQIMIGVRRHFAK
jgi:hypothetical protein